MGVTIRSVDAIALSIPWRATDPTSPWLASHGSQVLVRVATDDPALVGWGEAFAIGAPRAVCAVVDDVLSPALVGRSFDDPRDAIDGLQRATHIFAGSGIGQHAISGVDIALWDLAGKIAGVPVAELLGGARRTVIPAYASLLRYGSADDVAATCEAWLDAGFSAIKVHQTDVASIDAAVRAAGGHGRVAVDVNCAWSRDAAAERVRELDPLGLLWIEEPLWPPDDHPTLAGIAAATSTPIAAGENFAGVASFGLLMDSAAVDIVQPSVTKAGGITVLRDVLRIADARGFEVCPHAFYFGPGLAATIHLAAAFPSVRWVEYPAGRLERPLVHPDLTPRNGHIELPAGPGLGVEVDEQLLAAPGTASWQPLFMRP